jgi:dTMP kinase
MCDLRGKFIVFDGGEGCGKSTQTRLLQHRLEKEGYEVLCVRDPGTTGVGELIRGVLLNPVHKMGMRCEMLLYMAARAEMMIETILPALQAGRVVLSDRFVSSTLAYQLGGDGLSAEEIKRVAEVAIKGRWPDLTLIFDMPFEHSRQRVQPKFSLFPDDPKAEKDLDRIEQRPREYHEQVRKNYLAQIQADPQRYRLIHGDRAVEEVHEQVWRAVSELR